MAAPPDRLKWIQKIYREVVGVRRYETWAAVPMECNTGAQAFAKNTPGVERVGKFFYRRRRYLWTTTNKILDVDIDRMK